MTSHATVAIYWIHSLLCCSLQYGRGYPSDILASCYDVQIGPFDVQGRVGHAVGPTPEKFNRSTAR